MLQYIGRIVFAAMVAAVLAVALTAQAALAASTVRVNRLTDFDPRANVVRVTYALPASTTEDTAANVVRVNVSPEFKDRAVRVLRLVAFDRLTSGRVLATFALPARTTEDQAGAATSLTVRSF